MSDRAQVRFDHAAAAAAAACLRRLAAAIDAHATGRAGRLAAADHFRGAGRSAVEDLVARQGRRAAGLTGDLRAEAARIEADAVLAHRAQRHAAAERDHRSALTA